MKSQKTYYFTSLDGLRGLAFLMVVIAHTGQRFKEFYIAGKVGVVVFFILSAFLLMYHFLSESHKYKDTQGWLRYAVKRLFRIYPMYICILLIELFTRGFTVVGVLRHIFLIEASKHYWTIPVEMTFYVISPILAIFFIIFLKNKLIPILFSIMLLLVGYAIFYPDITGPFKTGGANEPAIIFYLVPFLLGTALAVIQNNAGVLKQIKTLSTTVVTIILISIWSLVLYSIPYSYNAIINSNYGRDFLNIFLFYSVIFAIMILLMINSRTIFTSLFESRWLGFIGSISYSGYLIHILVLEGVYTLDLPMYISLLSVLIVTVGIASITNRLVEIPFMGIGKKVTRIFQSRLLG